MNKKVLFSLCAFAIGVTAFSADDPVPAPKPVYTQYQDWQFQAVTVPDKTNGAGVRHQMDFTVPIHGPWLLNPAPDSITVNWITRIPCAGGIEYREKGTEEFTRLWTVTYGQIDYGKDLHTYHLKNLKPATEYEYRLLSAQDKNFGAYHDIYVGRELYSFKTIDPKRENYQVFVTSDFHGGGRLILDPMIANCKAENADFYFFLGDNVEDGANDIRWSTTFGFLDDVCRLWGKNKATVFLRGNHDLGGRESRLYGDYFPRPDGKSYCAISQGPVLFIVLDSMWTAGEKLQNEQLQKYREEQAEWIRAMKQTDAWKNAKFRIVMAHVGTHAFEVDWMGTTFKDVLNDDTDAGRIHLFLAGHEHVYYRVDPRSEEIKIAKHTVTKKMEFPPRWMKPFTGDFNYTLVTCNLAEGMVIDVSPEKLTVTSHRWNKSDRGFWDRFEIAPNGTIKDLIEMQSIPQRSAKKKK